jgi:MinD-like ATPase involved in chromosome partitioning or flagellar assembly
MREGEMTKIISVHSFRGGTGKSNIAANMAAIFATRGLKIAVVDTDIQSPGIHIIFGFNEAEMVHSLNDYLWGKCEIVQTAHDVTPNLGSGLKGKVYLVPSSINPGDIARVLHDGYDVNQLDDGFRELSKALSLDALIVDTHPGLNEETLLSISISDVLLIIMRPDQQDYQGTSVTLEVARKLEVPKILLLVNKSPSILDPADLAKKVAQTYGCSVSGVIPHSDELMTLASSGIFSLRYPQHPVSSLFQKVADQLLAE